MCIYAGIAERRDSPILVEWRVGQTSQIMYVTYYQGLVVCTRVWESAT